ncbi:unnamed protein product [Polarella glacialis]|uniref:Uncharacterized protein n=1 Tax=Polarella glacialis TaxID=89957 RepID=A0A813F1R9_POLGL|nr:unnamed protein product [Polarella glacialis]
MLWSPSLRFPAGTRSCQKQRPARPSFEELPRSRKMLRDMPREAEAEPKMQA